MQSKFKQRFVSLTWAGLMPADELDGRYCCCCMLLAQGLVIAWLDNRCRPPCHLCRCGGAVVLLQVRVLRRLAAQHSNPPQCLSPELAVYSSLSCANHMWMTAQSSHVDDCTGPHLKVLPSAAANGAVFSLAHTVCFMTWRAPCIQGLPVTLTYATDSL
jgi:hypothetical protein